MKPKPDPLKDQFQLFQANFGQLLNPQHPLVLLADKIDWPRFDEELLPCYAEKGRPGTPIRLMAGLCYLKYTFNISDEDMEHRWVENPYWQYFCGYDSMQHEFPIHYTAWIKWRKRMTSDRLKVLLQETIDLAVREKQLPKRDLKRVNVDTTVQEKNITYPTDTKLLHKAVVKLVAAARSRNIPLRQSYLRVSKRAAVKAGRYAHARQFKRMKRELRKLRRYVRALIGDIHRKAGSVDAELKTLLSLAQQVHDQRPKDSGKVYSLHEPHVQCISKGKAHKRYEFGCKVSVVTTNRSNWILASEALEGNPYDGHTLSESLDAVEAMTGVGLEEAFVDKGYRGHRCDGNVAIHIAGCGLKRATRALKKRRRRRSAVEPKIGHLKSDHRMGRCWLWDEEGDKINALLAGVGSNMRKLLKLFYFALRKWVAYKAWLRELDICLTQLQHWPRQLAIVRRVHTLPAA